MKIFVSHSSHDKWVARQISRLLEGEGHQTFLDEKDIKTGDSIDASIQTHLKDSDHLVLLISPASITSHWVFIELGGAKALGKRVVPILFHVGANEIPSSISQLLARDINDFDRYLAEIKSPVTTPLGSDAASHASAETKPSRSTAKRAVKIRHSPTPNSLNVQYRVGDRVRIANVEHLTSEDKAKEPVWVPAMDKYSGVETKVTEVGLFDPIVQVAADNGDFWWSDSWISKVE